MFNEIEAKTKLESAIAKNLHATHDVLNRIFSQVPEDAIVRARALDFAFGGTDEAPVLQMAAGNRNWTLHEHAARQVAERAGMPGVYFDRLETGTGWQRDLLSHALRETYSHSEGRHLVRAVNGQVRGFLSDRFRRLDSRPVIEAFFGEVQQLGGQPFGAMASDVRTGLKVILPEVRTIHARTVKPSAGDHRPVDLIEEHVAFGLDLSNSDYGAGTLSIRAFLLRLWCLNGATTEDVMREVHLGKRLGEEVEFSQQTYELDTRATVSAVRDIVRGQLAPAAVDKMVARVERSVDTEVDWKSLKAKLAKSCTKGEIEKIDDAFNGQDVLNLPPGQNAWRASNAISWVLKEIESADRKMELERLAGQVLAA